MSKYRKSAKGRQCMIRIPGVCNGNPETVVLCHLNGGGMGRKRNDIHAAFGCSDCHDAVDRRTREVDADFAKQCHLEGVIKTQEIWLEEGLL